MAASYGRVIVGGSRDMGFGYRPLCRVIAFAGLLTRQVFLLLNIWAKVDDARRAIVALKDFCTGFDRCSAQLGLISIISTCTKKTEHQWRHLHPIQCNPHCPMVCLRIQIQIYPGSSSYSSRSPLRDGPPNYRQHPPLLRLTFQISLASLIQDDYGWPSRNNKSPLFGCVFEQIFAQQ